MPFLRLKHASISVDDIMSQPVLAEFLKYCELIDEPQYVDLQLSRVDGRLTLAWNRPEQKTTHYCLEFEKSTRQLRSFPAPKQGAFNQALGKKSKSIIDATGGWGGDAMLMCLQGYVVTVIERLPIMAALLSDAFEHLGKSKWAIENDIHVPIVLCGDAAQVLPSLAGTADCIYLDPMFPSKKKKKAAVNKYMQLLQWLAGADHDASEVANIARDHFPRLAVKRPHHAVPLIDKPSTQFSSKLVHFDVYL